MSEPAAALADVVLVLDQVATWEAVDAAGGPQLAARPRWWRRARTRRSPGTGRGSGRASRRRPCRSRSSVRSSTESTGKPYLGSTLRLARKPSRSRLRRVLPTCLVALGERGTSAPLPPRREAPPASLTSRSQLVADRLEQLEQLARPAAAGDVQLRGHLGRQDPLRARRATSAGTGVRKPATSVDRRRRCRRWARKNSPAVRSIRPVVSKSQRKNAAIATECACRRSIRSLVERHVRRAHRAGDHHLGLGEPGQVVGAAHRVGDDQRGGARPTARAAGPLQVVGRARRHVAQHHRLQLADVDAELEGGRAGERVDLAADELLLDRGGLGVGPLRGVLHRARAGTAFIDGRRRGSGRGPRRAAAGRTARGVPRSRAPGRRRGPRPARSAGRRVHWYTGIGVGDPGQPQPLVVDLVDDARGPARCVDRSQSTGVFALVRKFQSPVSSVVGSALEPSAVEHPAARSRRGGWCPWSAARRAPCGSAPGPTAGPGSARAAARRSRRSDGTSSGIVTAPCWRSDRTSSCEKAQASSSLRPRASSGCGRLPGRVAVEGRR